MITFWIIILSINKYSNKYKGNNTNENFPNSNQEKHSDDDIFNNINEDSIIFGDDNNKDSAYDDVFNINEYFFRYGYDDDDTTNRDFIEPEFDNISVDIKEFKSLLNTMAIRRKWGHSSQITGTTFLLFLWITKHQIGTIFIGNCY